MVRGVAAKAQSVVRRAVPRPAAGASAAALPLVIDGFEDRHTSVPLIEALDDAELAALNELLDWKCFTLDSRGRRFGNRAWKGKRDQPQVIPDPRIVALDQRFDLRDKHVLEVGCFEGVHTIALCQLAGSVTAVDANLSNVVKTMVRCGFYGCRPTVLPCDVEAWDDQVEQLRADVVHHVGVLYHLREPVGHVLGLGAMARVGLLLDTHVAGPDDRLAVGVHDGVEYRYRRFDEGGGGERAFAGRHEHSRWLLLDHLVALLGEAGFGTVDVVDQRLERNGLRVTIHAAT